MALPMYSMITKMFLALLIKKKYVSNKVNE